MDEKGENTLDFDVSSKEIVASFLILLSLGAMILSVFSGMNTSVKGTANNTAIATPANTPAKIAPGPGGGESAYSYGGIQYQCLLPPNWNSLEVGIFSLTAYENSTINSKSQYVFSNYSFVPYRYCTWIASMSSDNGRVSIFWNLTYPSFQSASVTDDTTFTEYFTDFPFGISDNVEIGEVITAGGLGVNGWYTDHYTTNICWESIMDLALDIVVEVG